MANTPDYPLFSVVGVEMEYMLVDQHSFQVRPLLPELFLSFNDPPPFNLEFGDMAWSNELAAHVLEFKTNGPASSLAPLGQASLAEKFHQQVLAANKLLNSQGVCLMPGGVHPLMNPLQETRIWPYDREVYDVFDQMFHCQGHGWSNLQSTHINLPFAGDNEFASLHASIRALLPLLPRLSAASPYLEGKFTGFTDSRIEIYRNNQTSLPIIAGAIIPEAVFSQCDYQQQILNPIARAIAPYDAKKVLDPLFVNSRGAIARFDRGAIEIRLLDNQEAPCVDMALVDIIFCILKHSCQYSDQALLQALPTGYLREILLDAIRYGSDTVIDNRDYLRVLLIDHVPKRLNLTELWYALLEQQQQHLQPATQTIIHTLLKHGNLATRLIQRVGQQPSVPDLQQMCGWLTQSLATNQLL